MSGSDPFSAYLGLLKIRQSARRRDVRVMGYLSLILFLSTLGVGMVSGFGSREVYLVVGANVVFGIAFVMAWVRLQIITETIELMNHIPNQGDSYHSG